MTFKRLTSADEYMHIMNDDSSFEMNAPWGYLIDQQAIANNHKNVILMLDDASGVFRFKYIKPAHYEIHTSFLPKSRGELFKKACKEALDYMFKVKLAEKIYALIQPRNMAARYMANQLGFKFISEKLYYHEYPICLRLYEIEAVNG